jgi:hypothetical protein
MSRLRPLEPIGFRVGDRTLTYVPSPTGDPDGITVVDGLTDVTAVIAMDPAAWDDVTHQRRTFINLFLADELTFEQGGFGQLADWDPLLTYVHAGTPIYDPGRVDLSGVDLTRTFTLDDRDEDLAAFLAATGYLHLRGVFSPEEVAAATAEADRLADEARPGDDRSWWVTDAAGEPALCRIIYASQRSDVLASMEADPRLERLGHLLRDDLRLAPDRMEGSPVLIKVAGETKGLANIPWHQDCGMGGHAILCPSVSIGVQLTGSSPATGNLKVVAGSHGQSLHYEWERRLTGVPVVEVDTEPGDVTVHIQDVMHASPPPTGEGGRRTFYVTFYPPTLWEHIGEGQAYNDLIRDRQQQAAALAPK